jgi:deoxyribodipyrimidine photo-lyase
MTAYRRLGWNYALQRAAEEGARLGMPLVVLDTLLTGYPWASDRFHSFIIDGMATNEALIHDEAGVSYYPYVEAFRNAGDGLLEALALHACLVVTDDYPDCFLSSNPGVTAARFKVRFETVDSNGLLPVAAAERAFVSAYDFRRYLQRTLREHIEQLPLTEPLKLLSGLPHPAIPDEVLRRWPTVNRATLSGERDLAALPIDHSVAVTGSVGGSGAALRQLTLFLTERLRQYDEDRSDPEKEGASGLSSYLHFGHISTHEILAELARIEDWSPGRMGTGSKGAKQGWWGMTNAAESFLDELVTWRELGFNAALRLPHFNRYASLPTWARQTLESHAADPRPELYSLEDLETASTSDEVWNAAQGQLIREGKIHNYLRMVWGKKVIEWSPTPQQALDRLVRLNDKYALDGSDPNSISGIFWCFGRYDRPWPERLVLGKVRYMTSASAKKKFGLSSYLEAYRR